MSRRRYFILGEIYRMSAKGSKRNARHEVSKDVRKYVDRRLKSEGETKHSNSSFNVSSSSTATYFQLSSIATGQSDVTRIGDEIRLTKLDIGFNMAVGDSTNILRVLIFQWNLQTTPTDAEVFEDMTSNVTQLCGAVCRDSILARKMRVIKDLRFTLNSINEVNIYRRYMLRLDRLRKTRYIGGSTTLGVGQIWLMHISDSSAVTHPVLQSAYTLDFKDV